jgi:hypothetical protein
MHQRTGIHRKDVPVKGSVYADLPLQVANF